MDLQLRGKTVLITGASKGIGLACAHGFAAEGCNLHLAARSAEPMLAAKVEIEAEHGVQVTIRVTIEIEGGDKPACVVDTVSRLFFE